MITGITTDLETAEVSSSEKMLVLEGGQYGITTL